MCKELQLPLPLIVKSGEGAHAYWTLLEAANRITSLTFVNPAENITFEYDQGAYQLGRLTRMTDPSGSTQWSYNWYGKVIRKAQQTGPRVHVVEYNYNATGHMYRMIYPSGRILDYSYDAAGRIRRINIDGTTLVSDVAYHPFGPPATWTWGNGRTHARVFDLDGRLGTQTLGTEPNSPWAPVTRNIQYDLAGRIVKTCERDAACTQAPATIRTFSYDELDRLTGFQSPSTAHAYVYDANGNRTNVTVGSTTYEYVTATTSNRLQSVAPVGQPGLGKNYAHDSAGNRYSDGVRTWTYDDRGRMTGVTYAGGANIYQINGLGQRVTKGGTGVVNGPHRYLYDEEGRLIGEYDLNGNEFREVVFLGDVPIAVMGRNGAESLIDNGAAAATAVGTWTLDNVLPGPYGTNYHRKAAGTGTASFTWTPVVNTTQEYRVFARWVAGSDHASNATYTVHHAGGSTSVAVNQKAGGGEWNLLGIFTMAPQQSHRVVLTDSANGTVIADAIKIVPTSILNPVNYIHADHLNTPVRVVNQGNQTVWRWDPEPFGDTLPTTSGGFVFNHRYPGQLYDAETGLHYNYFRDYDPGIGRYIQSDPIGLFGGINTFAYVDNDPLRFVDPTGEARKTFKVPGTTAKVDVDSRAPTHPGSQRHAHVDHNGKTVVVNADGTPSHGSDPVDIARLNKKVKEFLRKRGFRIPGPVGLFLGDIWDAACLLTAPRQDNPCALFPELCI